MNIDPKTLLNDIENYIDELRISNDMYRMNQEDVAYNILEQLEVLLTKNYVSKKPRENEIE